MFLFLRIILADQKTSSKIFWFYHISNLCGVAVGLNFIQAELWYYKKKMFVSIWLYYEHN